MLRLTNKMSFHFSFGLLFLMCILNLILTFWSCRMLMLKHLMHHSWFHNTTTSLMFIRWTLVIQERYAVWHSWFRLKCFFFGDYLFTYFDLWLDKGRLTFISLERDCEKDGVGKKLIKVVTLGLFFIQL